MFHRDSFGKTLVALITAIALGALLISPLWVSAQGTDPESVIRAIIDAQNAKNIDAALALIADDTVITLIPPPPDSTGVFTGKEEIRGWWEAWIAGNGHTELSNFQVTGDNATYNDHNKQGELVKFFSAVPKSCYCFPTPTCIIERICQNMGQT